MIPELLQALAVVNGNSNADQKQQALTYLESFQKEQNAWNVVFEVLQGDYDVNLHMFAAQTLRNKVTYDLGQLNNLDQLKEQIIKFLLRYSNNRVISTQLCISLAKLCIQYISWKSPLQEIVATLPQNVLLEFLKILPEESLDIKSTPLTEEEFSSRTNELIQDHYTDIMTLLSQYAAEAGTNTRLLLQCLNSWITEVPIQDLLTSPLVQIVFQNLDTEFDDACECLVTIIRETRESPDETVQALYEQLMLLKSLVNDEDKLDGLTRLFVEACESWYVLVCKHAEFFKPLVEMLLLLTVKNEDLDVVRYTFPSWYNLKQMLVLERFKPSRVILAPIFLELINVMIKHLQYPDEFDSREEEDKFKEFRYEIGDVLKDCTAVVGAAKALQQPLSKIQQAGASWQQVEAPLFSLRTMAKEVSNKENVVLPQVFTLLVSLPEHPKVRYAATLVMGRYTEWTALHPEFLEPQLTYIFNGFQKDKDVIVASAHALKYFCQDCKMAQYIEQLYEFYFSILPQIDDQSLYDIMTGFGSVINGLPLEQTGAITWKFVSPLFQPSKLDMAQALFNEIRVNDWDNIHPVAELINTTCWPALTTIIANDSNMETAEYCCKMIRTWVDGFSVMLAPILPEMAEVLVKGYESTGYGCYLWTSGTLIKNFGDEEYSTPELKAHIWSFTEAQIQNFLSKIPQDVNSCSDLIQDFFLMMADVLSFYTVELLTSEVIDHVLSFGLMNVTKVASFDSYIAILHFIVDYLAWGFETPPISLMDEVPPQVRTNVLATVERDGLGIYSVILQGLVFNFTSDAHPDSIDIMIKIMKLTSSPELALERLSQAMSTLPQVTEQEKSKVLNLTALKNKDYRRMRNNIKDFVGWYKRKNISPRLYK